MRSTNSSQSIHLTFRTAVHRLFGIDCGSPHAQALQMTSTADPSLAHTSTSRLENGEVCRRDAQRKRSKAESAVHPVASHRGTLAAGVLTSELLLVTWHGPLSLLDHLLDRLLDLWAGSKHLVDGELIEGAGRLDVVQSRLEVLELGSDLVLGSLGLLGLAWGRR